MKYSRGSIGRLRSYDTTHIIRFWVHRALLLSYTKCKRCKESSTVVVSDFGFGTWDRPFLTLVGALSGFRSLAVQKFDFESLGTRCTATYHAAFGLGMRYFKSHKLWIYCCRPFLVFGWMSSCIDIYRFLQLIECYFCGSHLALWCISQTQTRCVFISACNVLQCSSPLFGHDLSLGLLLALLPLVLYHLWWVMSEFYIMVFNF